MIIHKKYKYVFYGLTSIILLVISTFIIPVIDKTESNTIEREYLFTSNDNFEVLKSEYRRISKDNEDQDINIKLAKLFDSIKFESLDESTIKYQVLSKNYFLATQNQSNLNIEILLFIDPKANMLNSSDLVYLLKTKLQPDISTNDGEVVEISSVSNNIIKVIYFDESAASYIKAVLSMAASPPAEFSLKNEAEILNKYLQQTSNTFSQDIKVEKLAQSRLKISITRSQGDILESELTNIENILNSDFYLVATSEISKADNQDAFLFNDRLRGFLIGLFLLAFFLLLLFVKILHKSKSPYGQISRIRRKNQKQGGIID